MPHDRHANFDEAVRCAQSRGRLCSLARQDWRRAYEESASISSPWYRVQTLAEIAQYADDPAVDRIIKQAGELAGAAGDEYRQVAVLAWVIDAAHCRGRDALADELVKVASRKAPSITPDSSLAAAMSTLAWVAPSLKTDQRIAFLELMIAASLRMEAEQSKRTRKLGTWNLRKACGLIQPDVDTTARDLLRRRLGAVRGDLFFARYTPTSQEMKQLKERRDKNKPPRDHSQGGC